MLGFYALDSLREADAKASLSGKSKPSPTLPLALNLIRAELVVTVLTTYVTYKSARSLQQKLGLPLGFQLAGWINLVVSLSLPLIHGRAHNQPYLERLYVLLFAFCPAFIILSRSYEALFYATFCTTLCCWVTLECKLARRTGNKVAKVVLSGEHLRIAVFFLVLLHVAFFGVGNVASISSFYLEPVFRLMPVFAPFPMAVLLLFKLLTPFVSHLPPFDGEMLRWLRLPFADCARGVLVRAKSPAVAAAVRAVHPRVDIVGCSHAQLLLPRVRQGLLARDREHHHKLQHLLAVGHLQLWCVPSG